MTYRIRKQHRRRHPITQLAVAPRQGVEVIEEPSIDGAGAIGGEYKPLHVDRGTCHASEEGERSLEELSSQHGVCIV